jgi:hypothetical protein
VVVGYARCSMVRQFCLEVRVHKLVRKKADKSFFILQGPSILWHFFAGKFVASTTRKASGAQFSPRSCEIRDKNNGKDTLHKYKKFFRAGDDIVSNLSWRVASSTGALHFLRQMRPLVSNPATWRPCLIRRQHSSYLRG